MRSKSLPRTKEGDLISISAVLDTINQAPCLKPQTTDDGGPEHEQRDYIDDGHNADDDDDDAEEDCGDNGSN